MSRLSLSRKKNHSTTPTAQSPEEMSNCPRCGKPVYFAERKVILGKDWHSHCLRCDNCDKPLTPGQHSAHLDRPYCNACYQAMFGPPGFRQGLVEPRKIVVKGEGDMSAGKKQEVLSKIREYNLYKESAVDKIKSREINGFVHFEGVLRIYWGLRKPITLAPGVLYSKNRASRASILDFVGGVDDYAYMLMLDEAAKKRRTIYSSGMKIMENAWDSKERMPGSEDGEDMLSMSLPAHLEGSTSLPGTLERRPKRGSEDGEIRRKISTDSTSSNDSDEMTDGNAAGKPLKRGTSVDSNSFNSRSPIRKRSASFKRISRAKKNEEKKDLKIKKLSPPPRVIRDPFHRAKRHQFTPPYGTPTNLRVTSSVSTRDVIIMLLAKFKVEDDPSAFGLCVMYDNGFQEPCKEDEYPLQLRLKLGPSEEIAKIYVMESSECNDIQISSEVAEWIKFSIRELEVFSKKFQEEEEKEEGKIKKRFNRWREAVTVQLEAIQKGGGYHETDI